MTHSTLYGHESPDDLLRCVTCGHSFPARSVSQGQDTLCSTCENIEQAKVDAHMEQEYMLTHNEPIEPMEF